MDIVESTGVEFNLREHKATAISIDEIMDIEFADESKIYWIHCNLKNENDFQVLAKKLKFDEEVISLCIDKDTIPKLSETADSLTLRIQCLLSTKIVKKQIGFGNLIIRLTPRYCFTASDAAIPALHSFIQNYQRSITYAKTPCFILFLLLDDIINDYSAILYDLELAADKIDFHIHALHRHSFNTVIRLRKQIMRIKRHSVAIRDILMRISGRKIAVISEQCRLSLVNLFDHSLMIVGQAEAIRDILNSLLEQIDNAIMHKMSESMKVLTAFAAIFLPLTLIAGIYGMNFRWIPELEWKYGYFGAIVLMLLIAIMLVYMFKKKKWF